VLRGLHNQYFAGVYDLSELVTRVSSTDNSKVSINAQGVNQNSLAAILKLRLLEKYFLGKH